MNAGNAQQALNHHLMVIHAYANQKASYSIQKQLHVSIDVDKTKYGKTKNVSAYKIISGRIKFVKLVLKTVKSQLINQLVNVQLLILYSMLKQINVFLVLKMKFLMMMEIFVYVEKVLKNKGEFVYLHVPMIRFLIRTMNVFVIQDSS